jgi:thioredoxin-like negative regulator of GroEL
MLALLVTSACKRDREKPPAAGSASAAPVAADPCAKAKAHGVFAWIEDDYASALACAKQKQLPLVLDLWAPWCHTCISMQTTVFADKALAPDAPKFVFAALDTDRDANAAAVAKFPPGAWPTFYVVGPKDEAVLARFVGAASVAQFKAFLDMGAQAMSGVAAGANTHLLAAERALANKDLATAETELVAALDKAPPEWLRRPDALVSLIGILQKKKDYVACVALAETWLDKTGNAASASDFMIPAMTCGEELAKEADEEVLRVTKLRERAVARWKQLVGDAAAPLSVDDRSDALANLRSTLEVLDRKPEAKEVAEQQRKLLDEAAAKATDATAASTYNWPRAEVYVYLERPLELVPSLQKSVKDLPTDYDPPARLGWVYMKAGKLAEAAAATEASIKLAYGPRKVRVLTQRAEIAKLQNDKPAEKKYRQEIVTHLKSLPPTQTSPEAIAKAEKAVAELGEPGMDGSANR